MLKTNSVKNNIYLKNGKREKVLKLIFSLLLLCFLQPLQNSNFALINSFQKIFSKIHIFTNFIFRNRLKYSVRFIFFSNNIPVIWILFFKKLIFLKIQVFQKAESKIY
jgi:hypothetical protein